MLHVRCDEFPSALAVDIKAPFFFLALLDKCLRQTCRNSVHLQFQRLHVSVASSTCLSSSESGSLHCQPMACGWL